jgi:hypothetical protein
VADALLRLGSLAGEAQAVIDVLTADLLDRCVSEDGPEAIRIDRKRCQEPFSPRSWFRQPLWVAKTVPDTFSTPYLVRELLLAIWRRQGWPLQAMGFAEWDCLAEMLAGRGDCQKRTFPGGVFAETTEAGLRLWRA